jgi:predicted RNA-binding Zn-ribbon protein involved in translation (DUF1610 family)
MHKHRCSNGHIWEHINDCHGWSIETLFNAAHTCPECGEQQFWKYEGAAPCNIQHMRQCTMSEPLPVELIAKLHQWTGL